MNDQIFGSFCAKWQAEIFSKATHLFIDIVYIRNDDVPGLLNIVAPSALLRGYVPVFRVFLNKQNAESISFVCRHAFQHINKEHSEFRNGEAIKQIMVNYSDAEENGLRDALGDEFVEKVLRGCKFHFLQSVAKVAAVVTETDTQKTMF